MDAAEQRQTPPPRVFISYSHDSGEHADRVLPWRSSFAVMASTSNWTSSTKTSCGIGLAGVKSGCAGRTPTSSFASAPRSISAASKARLLPRSAKASSGKAC